MITTEDNETLEQGVAKCEPFKIPGFEGVKHLYGDGTRSYEVYAGRALVAILLDTDDRGWHVSFFNDKLTTVTATHLMLVVNRYFDVSEARRAK